MISYVKATITLEAADGSVEIIEIPKASHIRIDTRGSVVEHYRYGDLLTTQDLEIALTGSYDDKEGCIFRRTIREPDQVTKEGK